MENKITLLPSSMSLIRKALAEMALMRGAVPSAAIIKSYTDRLARERTEDVLAALQTLQDLPRKEGELAFPEIGLVLSMVENVRVARFNREKAAEEVFQQQQCPKCLGIVGMMRARSEQSRTWCMACQEYRKIIPEDLTLTDGEWHLLRIELQTIYREWKKRGSKPWECVDPQFDRELVRGRA